ncbi:MAG: hypothetical protein P8Y18_04660 [Candidatus Bathyarchaeota archaeon]
MAADEEDAAIVISNAESFIGETFESILLAEQAGANVSNLLDQMTIGGEYLSEANVMYRAGAYEDAVLFADLSIETVNEIRAESLQLIGTAENNFNLTIFWSILGVILVSIVGFVSWSFFKKYYLEQS